MSSESLLTVKSCSPSLNPNTGFPVLFKDIGWISYSIQSQHSERLKNPPPIPTAPLILFLRVINHRRPMVFGYHNRLTKNTNNFSACQLSFTTRNVSGSMYLHHLTDHSRLDMNDSACSATDLKLCHSNSSAIFSGKRMYLQFLG